MDEATGDGVEVGRRVRESLKEDGRVVAKMQVMAKYWPFLDDDYLPDPEQQLEQPKANAAISVNSIAKEQLRKALRASTCNHDISSETSQKLSAVIGTMIDNKMLEQQDTPLALVYDLDHLRTSFERCTEAFPAAFTHCFAMKAAPMSFIAKEAIDANFGIECASRLEVANALRNGCSPAKVVFDAPAKTHSEIRYALEQGVCLNCNTLDELERVASIYDEMGGDTSSRIGVRVNPLLGAGKIKALSVSTASSKFGVSDLDSVRDAFKAHPWLSMLHVHVGSQGCSVEMLAEGVGVIANLADEINAAASREQVKVLDIGGGLPVDYDSCNDSPSFQVRTILYHVLCFTPAVGSVTTQTTRWVCTGVCHCAEGTGSAALCSRSCRRFRSHRVRPSTLGKVCIDSFSSRVHHAPRSGDTARRHPRRIG